MVAAGDDGGGGECPKSPRQTKAESGDMLLSSRSFSGRTGHGEMRLSLTVDMLHASTCLAELPPVFPRVRARTCAERRNGTECGYSGAGVRGMEWALAGGVGCVRVAPTDLRGA